ncbi:MucR family transcriptional regulator [Modestobacter lapidis]
MGLSAMSPHVPVARLPDGTPVFAPLGQLVVADAGRRVVCHACGDLLTHISPAHLHRHRLDGQAYRRSYRLALRRSLVAPGLADVRAQEGRRRYTGNEALRAGLEHGQRRTHRLAEARLARARTLGFDSVEGYLRHRYVEQAWSVHAIGAELRTGRRVPPRLMDAAGVARRAGGGRRAHARSAGLDVGRRMAEDEPRREQVSHEPPARREPGRTP